MLFKVAPPPVKGIGTVMPTPLGGQCLQIRGTDLHFTISVTARNTMVRGTTEADLWLQCSFLSFQIPSSSPSPFNTSFPPCPACLWLLLPFAERLKGRCSLASGQALLRICTQSGLPVAILKTNFSVHWEPFGFSPSAACFLDCFHFNLQRGTESKEVKKEFFLGRFV